MTARYYPGVGCEHGFDACPICDKPESDDRAATAATAQGSLPLDPKDSDDYNNANWLGTPFTDVDWANCSAIVGYLRLKANEAAEKDNFERAISLNEMADKLVRTRKKIQARIAHRNGQ